MIIVNNNYWILEIKEDVKFFVMMVWGISWNKKFIDDI